jgi:hypothetical protein
MEDDDAAPGRVSKVLHVRVHEGCCACQRQKRSVRAFHFRPHGDVVPALGCCCLRSPLPDEIISPSLLHFVEALEMVRPGFIISSSCSAASPTMLVESLLPPLLPPLLLLPLPLLPPNLCFAFFIRTQGTRATLRLLGVTRDENGSLRFDQSRQLASVRTHTAFIDLGQALRPTESTFGYLCVRRSGEILLGARNWNLWELGIRIAAPTRIP